jgi:hypothetical protein
LAVAVEADVAASEALVVVVAAEAADAVAEVAAAYADEAAFVADADASPALAVAVAAELAAALAEAEASDALVVAVVAEAAAEVEDPEASDAFWVATELLAAAAPAWYFAEYSVEPETMPVVFVAHSCAAAAPDCASLSKYRTLMRTPLSGAELNRSVVIVGVVYASTGACCTPATVTSKAPG